MAEKEDEKKNIKEKDENQGQTNQPRSKTGILTWIIMAVIILTLTGSGYVVGRLFAGSGLMQKAEPTVKETQKEKSPSDGSATNSKDTWYYDLEPIVANLNEPGAMRYVRASITMQINASWEKIKAETILELQKPRLRSWLAIYLASLTTEDATGPQNLRRIQLEILDAFNEILFQDARPQIKQILFKEGLAIQ